MDITHTVILIGACCANVNVDSNVKNIWSTAVCGRKNWYNGKIEHSRNLRTSNFVSREACVNGQANFAIESWNITHFYATKQKFGQPQAYLVSEFTKRNYGKSRKWGKLIWYYVETAITRTQILIGACCANVNVDSNVENIWSTAVCGRKNW